LIAGQAGVSTIPDYKNQTDLAQLPLTDEQIAEAASAQGLTVPERCHAGLKDNLEIISRHVSTMRGISGKNRH
jgi:hypothetical protein